MTISKFLKLKKALFLFVLICYYQAFIAQTTVPFTTPGTTTWTVPACVTSITVQAWGGGGGGGAAWSRITNGCSSNCQESCNEGGGGGGGGFTSRVYAVTPGEVYTIVVGAGGTGGTSTSGTGGSANAGGAGGNSTFSGPATVGPGVLTAIGGGGGGAANGTNSSSYDWGGHVGVNGTAGTGGGGLNGTTTYNGGNGTAGAHSGSCYDFSGAGGGGAGTGANGANGSANTCPSTTKPGGAGGASFGGNGADAGRLANYTTHAQVINGANGVIIGGGGAGTMIHYNAAAGAGTRNGTGGAGARGEVRIIFSTVSAGITSVTSPTITCLTSTVQSAISYTNGATTFNWSGPGIVSGGTTGTVSVNVAGAYVYTATVGGCSSTGTVNIAANTASPTISSTSAGTLTCTNTLVTTGVVSPSSPISHNWSGPSVVSGGSSASASVNQPGTYNYTVTNTSNGCQTFGSTSVTQNTITPDVNGSVTNSINCAVTTASVIASTIATPVSYNWSGPGIVSGANTATATVNADGIYNYSVTNTGNGCRSTGSVSVTAIVTNPDINANGTPSLNCTVSSATLNVNYTLPNVTVAWTGPSAGNPAGSAPSNSTTIVSAPGTYTVRVTNLDNGCSSTTTLAVTQNTTLPHVAASAPSSITCITTTANAIASSTTTPVSFNWSGTGITSASNISTITVNQSGVFNYTVTNTDNGCSRTGTVNVNSNTTAPSATAVASTSLTCTNTTITLSGGPASGVSYAWSGPGLTGATNAATATANAPGSYTLVTTSAANGCTNSAVASVSQNTTVPTTTISPSSFSTTCATPTVQLSATGTGLTYTWTPPSTGSLNNTNISNPIANGSGVFTVVATNTVNGCLSTVATATVVADAGAPTVSLSTSSTSLSCLTTAQTVTASVSAGSFSYVWSPAPASGAGTGTVTINNPGTYSVTVTNTVNGCATDAFVSVSQNTVAPMVSASAPASITCLSPTTSAVASTSTSPASYNWSGPGIVSGNATATVNVNTGGTYNYTVTDSNNGCSSTGTVAVSSDLSVPTLTLAPASHTTTCASPTVQLTASGTPGSLTYTWTSPSTGSISDNSIANPIASGSGVFTVVATNTVNGCSTPQGVYTASVIADAGLPVINLSASSLTIDCNAATQTATANVSVGTVTYSWSPAPSLGQGTSSATFDSPGTYTVVVTNTVNGCESTSFVSVDQNTVTPVMTAISDQTLTCALPTTSLTASASPSVGTSYNWSGPGITSGTNTATAIINAGGSYTVIATAANGCTTSATANVIDNNTPITATVTPSSTITNITCTNTMVTLSAAATPTNDITFVWSTGGSSTSENVSLPGVVTVTLINSVTGCSTTAQFAVTQNTIAPDVAFANATFPCGPLTSTVNASSTNTNVTYTWSGTGIVSGASSSSPEINSPGTYSVTITDNITGCSTNTTVLVGLATINASFTPSSNFGEAPAVISFSNQSTGADTYNWSFGDGGASTDINPNYTYNTQGSYTVILTASAGLCSDTASTIIIIDEGFEVYIPNVFTPNNDGPNDVFYVKTKGVKDLQGDIFNRWGQLMYSMKGINDFWDGKAPNSELVPDGTYFYILNITDNKNKNHIYNGSVNLYR